MVITWDKAERRDQRLRINSEEAAWLSSFALVDSNNSQCPVGLCYPPISIKPESKHLLIQEVTLSSPSPVLSFVEKVPQDGQISHVTASDSENQSNSSRTLRDVHISMRLMEDFLELAKESTEKDLETCGILSAILENGTFYMTTLIIPKQESTSSSCQATSEEEVFAILNERSLFLVGWIHTHPSQSCFMSSVDLHTQYSYQVMVPEAFAIVMAPTDTTRSCGLFRLTDPVGMGVLKNCQEEGFHPHKEPDSGSPVYEHCSNVYKNSNLRFEIFDLR
ncbi:hypothetical protein L6164_027247 [Bauhinia variegata]|uniref:Uncharacterized protein n=1 Tax=Bauhinia variegata TaxID=167791 RepID=A0ACB9LSB4_BAUVA|nr:hypothetical protein L6164_027247 [Bauhinia variegata]